MAHVYRDKHFTNFGESLELMLSKYGDLSESEVLDTQRRQFHELVDLEDEFRRELIAQPKGAAIYREFISHICDTRRNILSARPYFRERQGTFAAYISDALKARDHERLFDFHVNWNFVTFAMEGPCKGRNLYRRWRRSNLPKIAKKIENLRREIVETNLPLAINRASIFWRRTSQVKLEFMDLVQICVEGLVAAVDKFCLPFTPVWRSVAIGRMVGNMIEVSSDTVLHFFPNDRRKIYRANKLIGRFQGAFADLDFDVMAEKVNHNAGETSQHTTPGELSSLMSAISCGSIDSAASGEIDFREPARKFAAESSWQPDVRCEEADATAEVRNIISQLPLLEAKLVVQKTGGAFIECLLPVKEV